MRTLIPKAKIEQTLEQKKHPEKRGMINTYICTNCYKGFTFVYLDTGVTPATIQCPNCNEMTAESCMCPKPQPDSVWYRPKDLDEIKQIVEDSYKHDEKYYEEVCANGGFSEKEMKGNILANYITHYNQGGLFSKTRI